MTLYWYFLNAVSYSGCRLERTFLFTASLEFNLFFTEFSQSKSKAIQQTMMTDNVTKNPVRNTLAETGSGVLLACSSERLSRLQAAKAATKKATATSAHTTQAGSPWPRAW